MAMMPVVKLSILMPVYNEAATLRSAVKRVLNVVFPVEIELVIVDDGRTDGTRALYAEWRDEPRVLIHEKAMNGGKGSAIRKGAELATGDYVIMCDADLEYAPEDWPKLITPVLRGKARVVYGSRFTGERRNMLFFHWVGNRFLSLVTNVLYNTTLSDMETCYKLVDRELLLDLGLRCNRFDIEPEITAKILKRGIRIYETPISYTGREFDEGKKITWRDGFAALWTLAKFRFAD